MVAPSSNLVCNSIQPTKATALQSPILWLSAFSQKNQDSLVSASNPDGAAHNCDLELAGTIAHDDVLASTVPVTHLTLCSFCDNTPSDHGERRKVRPTPKQQHTSSKSQPFTDESFVIRVAQTISQGLSMQWRMTAHGYGTCQTHNCLLTLILIILRQPRGKCASFGQR